MRSFFSKRLVSLLDAKARNMSLITTLEQALHINIRQHAKNAGMLTIGAFGTALLGLGVSIALANILTKEQFGEYRYILGLLNAFNSFALTGMNMAVTQAVAKGSDGDFLKALRFQMKWGLFHTLGGLGVSAYLYLIDKPIAALCLVAISLVMPTANAFNTFTAYLQGKKYFTLFSATNILQSLVIYGSIAVALFATQHIVIMTLANIFATLATNLVFHWYVVKTYPPGTQTDSSTQSFGVKLSGMWGLRLLVDQLDTFFIYSFLGPTALASYAVITTIPERLKGFIKFGPLVALPDHAQRELQEIVPALRKKLLLMMVGLAIVTVGYVLLSPMVFRFFYPTYTELIPLIQLYGVSFLFAIHLIPLNILFSQKASGALASTITFTSILQILCMVIGLVYFKLPGAIAGKLIFQLLQACMYYLALELAYTREKGLRAITQ